MAKGTQNKNKSPCFNDGFVLIKLKTSIEKEALGLIFICFVTYDVHFEGTNNVK